MRYAEPEQPVAVYSSPDAEPPAAPSESELLPDDGPSAQASAEDDLERLPSFGDGVEYDSEPDERAPSFGDGVEHSARGAAPPVRGAAPPARGTPPANGADERLPSFGDGAELPPDTPEAAPDPYAAPRRSAPAPYPPGQVPSTPPARVAPPLLPEPPPVRSEAAIRLVYQMQTEVYGIQVALAGRPILPRLVLRIDALQVMSRDLLTLSRGRPRQVVLADHVSLEVTQLQRAAMARDRAAMHRSLTVLEDLLARMR